MLEGEGFEDMCVLFSVAVAISCFELALDLPVSRIYKSSIINSSMA
jgi:hypothetical protein